MIKMIVFTRSAHNWHVMVYFERYIAFLKIAIPRIAKVIIYIVQINLLLLAQHLQVVIALLEVPQQQFVQLGPTVQGALP